MGIQGRTGWLIEKDDLVLKARESLADELTLGSVSIIDNQAYRSLMSGLHAAAGLSQQLEIHRIQEHAPFDITVIHKTIEYVLLTTEQAA